MLVVGGKVIKTSPEAKAFVEYIKNDGGNPSKYKEDEHIALLFEVFQRGEGMMAFCAEALITQDTFYTWLDRHPNFSKAYKTVKNICGKMWENMPKDDPTINFSWWQCVMKNRFGYTKNKIRMPTDKTPENVINSALEGLEHGEITTQEATQIASIAVDKANIQTQTIITDELKLTPESKEQLMEKVKAIGKVLENNKKVKPAFIEDKSAYND